MRELRGPFAFSESKRPYCFAKGHSFHAGDHTKPCGGEGEMIASETEGKRSLVRIHDEYCESEPEAWLPRLNKIVTDAYRRRVAEMR